MKRLTLIILSTALILSLFASCAAEQASDDKTADQLETKAQTESAVETVAGLERAGLPVEDFSGADFVFLHGDSEDTASNGYAWRMIDSDEQIGEVLNDEIYKRNKKVEALYGVEISVINNSGDIQANIKNSVNANDNAYDAIFCGANYLLPLSQENYLAEWGGMPYIDTTAEWWDQSVVEGFTVYDKLYLCTGDISPLTDCRVYAIIFNKDMCRNLELELPYASVFDGTWTLDKFNYYITNVNNDVNGDSKMDFGDRWGFVSQKGSAWMMFFSGGGTVVNNNGDEPVLSLSTERNITLATTALTISTDTSKTLMADDYANSNGWPAVSSWFANGGALMRSSTFEPIPRDFRAMETDFGVLPYPKLDESQERYYTLPEHTSFMIAFPTTCNKEMSGLIIESMAAESTFTVKEAFYEICLNEKSVRDEESKKILEIIFDSKHFDIGYFLDFGGVRSQIQSLETKGNTEAASAFEKINKQAQKVLEKFLEKYAELEA